MGTIILFMIFVCVLLFLLSKNLKFNPPPQEQINQYKTLKSKTIFELQPFRTTSSIKIRTKAGEQGEATLVNLNPYINTWYILTIHWDKSSSPIIFHLENPMPYFNTYFLDATNPYGIVIKTIKINYTCNLWLAFQTGLFEETRKSSLPFTALCGGYLYVRNKIKGNKTINESATDFLRRHVPGGENISKLFKENIYKDKFARTSKITKNKKSQEQDSQQSFPGLPIAASVDPDYAKSYLEPDELG